MKQWLRIEIVAWLLCVGSMALTGCKAGSGEPKVTGKTGAKAPGSSDVVARVGNVEITAADFESQLSQQNPMIRAKFNSPDQKRKLLDGLVEREVLAQEAKRLGLEKDPEVQQGIKRILAAYYVRSEFNNKHAKDLTVPDADIEKYYEENISHFKAPEKVRVQQVAFSAPKNNVVLRKKSKIQAQEALKELQAKPQDQALFEKIMHGSEADKTGKPSPADTPSFKDRDQLQQEYGKAFADAAFALKQANDLSGLMEDEKGYYFLRQTGRQPALDMPLDKVKDQIRATLLGKVRMDAYQTFIEETKRKVGVQVFENVLDKIQLDAANQGPQNPPPLGVPPQLGGPPQHGAPPPLGVPPPPGPPKDKPMTGDKPAP
jgi:peptidyl-prolyl cis-trans isomerase C